MPLYMPVTAPCREQNIKLDVGKLSDLQLIKFIKVGHYADYDC